MISTSAEDQVTVQEKCPRCKGKKLLELFHCPQCGAVVDADHGWWQGTGPLPCGHITGEVDCVEVVCSECAGSGLVQVSLPRHEWQVRNSRRLRRAALLGLLLLIPFGLLAWAILSQEPPLVCGSWWYGLLLPLLLLWR